MHEGAIHIGTGAVVVGLIALVGFLWRQIGVNRGVVDKVEDSFQDYRVKVAETYMSKVDTTERFNKIDETLKDIWGAVNDLREHPRK